MKRKPRVAIFIFCAVCSGIQPTHESLSRIRLPRAPVTRKNGRATSVRELIFQRRTEIKITATSTIGIRG